jgi:hypothetical protein
VHGFWSRRATGGSLWKATRAMIKRGLTVSLKALRGRRFIHELVWRSL